MYFRYDDVPVKKTHLPVLVLVACARARSGPGSPLVARHQHARPSYRNRGDCRYWTLQVWTCNKMLLVLHMACTNSRSMSNLYLFLFHFCCLVFDANMHKNMYITLLGFSPLL